MEQTDLTTPKPETPFTRRDALALFMALALSLLWFSVFGLNVLFAAKHLPGTGGAAFTAAIWAAVLIYLGREARWNKYNAFLAAGVGLLALCCVVYGNDAMKLINLLLIASGSALCFFSLSGSARRALTDVRVVADTAVQTLLALFANWGKPFRALGALGDGSKRTARQILLGVLISVPVLAVVLWLLSDADAVFGSLFAGLAEWLRRANAGTLAWRTLRTVVLTLMLFSALFFLRHAPEPKAPAGERRPAPAAAFVTVTSLLCAVYAVFAVIQFACLFGGVEAAAMEGGYAEYARSGFFQLLRVAVIDLVVVLSCAALSERSRLLNIMSTILLALTAVILFSAFWRMRLYISAYGLSLLRAMTLWAMAFIAVCLALAALRIWKPGFKFWPFFAAVGLTGWLLFNFVNVDARIAESNVDAYLQGRAESVDIYYLSTLSPETLPALERLREAEGSTFKGEGDSDFYLECDLDDAINNIRSRNFTPSRWTEWSLSWYLRANSAGVQSK